MPQSSLLGWLKKPTTKPEQEANQPSIHQTNKDAPPTPPRSSPEDDETRLSSPTTPNPRTAETKPSHPLNPKLELRACKKEDIPHLKQLTSLLLPIPYPENFYREIIDDPLINSLTLLAIWHDKPQTDDGNRSTGKGRLIGAIRCKILDPPPSTLKTTTATATAEPMLYLSTLVLLSPFRSQGIASQMLDVVTKRAVNDYGVTSVGAHVWEANADALEWYRKRGFTAISTEPGYYRRLNPTGAVVMQRRVGVMDLLGG